MSQQKEKEISWCQNRIIILQGFSQKRSISNRNKKTEILMNKPGYFGLSILELCKILMCEFNVVMENQNMMKKQNCVIWIQAVSLYT